MTLPTRSLRDEIILHLLALHLPALRIVARCLTRNSDRSDDLVQDSVENSCGHIGHFTLGTNLRGWLCTILRNGYHSDLRKWRGAKCRTPTEPLSRA